MEVLYWNGGENVNSRIECMSRDNDLFHFAVGDFKCLAIRDGCHDSSADFLFLNAPEGELDATLKVQNLKRDQFWTTWTCLLVDTGRK